MAYRTYSGPALRDLAVREAGRTRILHAEPGSDLEPSGSLREIPVISILAGLTGPEEATTGGILWFRRSSQSKEYEDRAVQANHVFVVEAADPGPDSVF